MSQFQCICGKVTRSEEEPRDASGVLHSIADLQAAEDRIGRLLGDYSAPRIAGRGYARTSSSPIPTTPGIAK